ncbi:MAG: tRNA (N(6)-L-threonylcarbamoyladenosine(37)-C(2))-methylthiotransferase [Candidatus Thorarchaeota archaeon]
MEQGRFYLETYGCSLNKSDSDIIVGHLSSLGAERVDKIENANLVILNSCGVKEPTEDRIVHRLEELSRQSAPVVIAGCLPRISINRVKSAIPEFAALLGPQSIESLGPIVERVLHGERGIIHLDSDSSSKLSFFEGPPSSVICTVPICEGCLGSCAYCAVRFARGDVRSYSISEISRVVDRCVHLGYREIRLTSQDAGVFGHDTGETLPALLTTLDLIEGPHILRLGMFNPNLVIDSIGHLTEIMASNHYFKFFHIPLQSGSDYVLDRMERQYSTKDWIGIVNKVTRRFPKATVATDIIVGFPGETEVDFESTIALLERVKPSIVNISKYGDRPGTRASKSKEKVDTSVKKERSRKLSSFVSKMIAQHNESWIGWTGPVLVTEPGSKGGVVCRNFAYKPVVILEDLQYGDYVNVEVTSAQRTHLIAQTRPD